MPSFTLHKVAVCRVPVVEKFIMKMQVAKTRGELNGIREAYRHSSSIFAPLRITTYQLQTRMILGCFSFRIRNWRKKFSKRRERLLQKKFALIRSQHIDFRKRIRNLFCKITLVNATCFQLNLENYVKARQTSDSLSTDKQTLAATVSTLVFFCQ